ncbi:MAG: hypothetical protein GY763_06775 [Gammaproteobacteria bacterium]|nr:hypothetical protein [Gammaproteobacteria bacterium]
MATEQKKYKLSEALEKLSSEKLTGTLICVNEQNLQGRIFVKNGNVLMARCRNYEGKDALEIIQKHHLTLLKFHSNKNLVSLEKDGKRKAAHAGAKGATESQDISAIHKSLFDIPSMGLLQDDARFTAPVTAGIREVITEELTEHIGPLAEILVSELPEGISLIEAITTLSHDIGEIELTTAFIESIKARI